MTSDRNAEMNPRDPVSDPASKLLIVIIGPTAVGKTEISIQLAERLGGEIVSADSRTFYRGMDIGTAKPSIIERQRVPHYLIDVADPDQVWSLALFQREANLAISEIYARDRLPLLVGGTGQYVRSIVEGWHIPEVRPDLRLRNALNGWADEVGAVGLHDRLAVIDPAAASRIDARNLRRTVRALEVILSSGIKFTDLRRRGTAPYKTLTLGLTRSREELYARVDARIESMINAGLIDEVQGLLDRGYPADLPTMSAIGYREIINYLQGEITLDEAVMLIKRATRKFVRRQANWFKADDPNIAWFMIDPNTVDEMERTILSRLPD